MIRQLASLLLPIALLASSSSAEMIVKRQRPGLVACAAQVYEDVPAVLKGCNFINIYNITVPAGKTLDLSTALPNSVIFIGRAITFLPSPGFAGPLVKFGGSGLYVNGGSGVFDGVGYAYWNKTGTKPGVVVSIDNVKNSVFEKLTLQSSPQVGIAVTRSSGLTFKNTRVFNNAGAGLTTDTDAITVASSSNIQFAGLNITTQGDCFRAESGSNIQVTNGFCNGGGYTFGSRTTAVQLTNAGVSNSTAVNAPTGVTIATTNTRGATNQIDGVTVKDVTISGATSTGILLGQDFVDGKQGGVGQTFLTNAAKNIKLTNVNGTVTGAGVRYSITVPQLTCTGATFTGVSVTGGSGTSKCSCTPAGFTCA